jgi:predicted amidohydrolase YtcJ
MGYLRMLEGLRARGGLRLRFRGNLVGEPWPKALIEGGLGEPGDPDFLTVGGVKLFSDGSLGSRSAWLRREYHDRPGHLGEHNFEDAELLPLVERARDLGLQVAIHAIGDRAIGQAVGVMGRALGSAARERRFRIEHFQVTDLGLIEGACDLGLIPSVQTVGLMYDLWMAPLRLGPERIRDSYAWRRILDRGILINGSDAPIDSPNPFHGIYAAVSRRDLDGLPEGGFQPGDAMTLAEALNSYTAWAAWAAFQGDSLGGLSVGKLCDMVVLDKDLFSVPERGIADLRPLLTVVGGEPAWADPAAFPGLCPGKAGQG